jgi:hypothetical protein
MTAASEPDTLAGVERWARVRGLLYRPTDGERPRPGERWNVSVLSDRVQVWDNVQSPALFEATSALALAWALLVETDAGPVDVGRCPTCRGRECLWRWMQGYWSDDRARVEHDATGWHEQGWHAAVIAEETRRFGRRHWRVVRVKSERCPVCYGTGRETIPVARLLLDAASNGARSSADGKSIMRDADRLLVHADQLQALGDPLGELLGLALGPWAGEPVDCGPCDDERCENGLTDSGGVTQWDTPAMMQCPSCSGSGRLLGHPHTAAALAWLERLTWAREVERDAVEQAASTRVPAGARHRT